MPTEPWLETHEIQGNVLPGFNKDHQILLGLQITETVAVKRWLAFITPEIATTDEVLRWKELRRRLIARRGYEPAELTVVWLNLAFSVAGLKKLAPPDEVAQFEDDGFQRGLFARSATLGDSQAEDAEGFPSNWKVGGREATTPDVFLILAGDDARQLEAKLAWLKDSLAQFGGFDLMYEEAGHDLPGDLRGHEHFGFKDGISQPGVRGRLSESPQDFLTLRMLDSALPEAALLSQPGQPLVWPGQFVFGYETQDSRFPLLPGPVKTAAPVWARNGSFLVFRRLRQDVARFWRFMEQKAAELAATEGFQGITARELAALLVGRWPSGAPVMRAPHAEDTSLAQAPANNHFQFARPSRPLPLRPDAGLQEDTAAPAPADLAGMRCPMGGHIRKVNPRDLTTEQGNSTDVLTRRILRRGIPFGPALPDPTAPDPSRGERGLLFLCYQTSILDQFEFLSRNWMNTNNAPETDPGGQDVLVGQAIPGQPRRCLLLRESAGVPASAEVAAADPWIIPTGGGYFFAPSITALRRVLSS